VPLMFAAPHVFHRSCTIARLVAIHPNDLHLQAARDSATAATPPSHLRRPLMIRRLQIQLVLRLLRLLIPQRM